MSKSPVLLSYLILNRLASLRNRYVLALFYVSLNSIYCIVVSSLLFSPSIYKSCFVICLQLPRLD